MRRQLEVEKKVRPESRWGQKRGDPQGWVAEWATIGEAEKGWQGQKKEGKGRLKKCGHQCAGGGQKTARGKARGRLKKGQRMKRGGRGQKEAAIHKKSSRPNSSLKKVHEGDTKGEGAPGGDVRLKRQRRPEGDGGDWEGVRGPEQPKHGRRGPGA